jgi:hypothetical protein
MTVCLTLSNEISDNTWKKQIPLINGLGTEGIGSVFQYHVMSYFFSEYLDVDFTFPGSENLSHHSYTEYSEREYYQSIDSFFNFPNHKTIWDSVYQVTTINQKFFDLIEKYKNSDEKILINMYKCHLDIVRFCASRVSEVFTEERIDKIRNRFSFDGEKYFDDDVNISLHLRTPNPNDVKSEIVSSLRELYFPEKDFGRYKNLIGYLKSQLEGRKATLHIHSQGFTNSFQEFEELKDSNFDIQTHLDDHPISDIYHMSNADLLIMSNSSFSWVSSLLNSNQKIVRDNFTNGAFVHNSIKSNYNFTTFS